MERPTSVPGVRVRQNHPKMTIRYPALDEVHVSSFLVIQELATVSATLTLGVEFADSELLDKMWSQHGVFADRSHPRVGIRPASKASNDKGKPLVEFSRESNEVVEAQSMNRDVRGI